MRKNAQGSPTLARFRNEAHCNLRNGAGSPELSRNVRTPRRVDPYLRRGLSHSSRDAAACMPVTGASARRDQSGGPSTDHTGHALSCCTGMVRCPCVEKFRTAVGLASMRSFVPRLANSDIPPRVAVHVAVFRSLFSVPRRR